MRDFLLDALSIALVIVLGGVAAFGIFVILVGLVSGFGYSPWLFFAVPVGLAITSASIAGMDWVRGW